VPDNPSPTRFRTLTFIIRYFVSPRASLFLGASIRVRGERAKALGWEPRPVVLEDWAEEGIIDALAKLK